ncbi:MAG: SAM-dependent methyltransferase [Campylobacterota bacterium]|nr:SAM-dependent methyltransferase [Campylobacterota bacterium]
MKFSEYMYEWLYGKDGYYSKYRQIGKGGDFYTAVSTSKFFGGTIAKHIIKCIDDGFLQKDSMVCEIGAHHGYLLSDIIEFIHTLRPGLISTLRFAIVERFDDMQNSQRDYFKECFGDVIKLEHFKSLNELHVKSAFFVANEIFDAFECELIYKGKTATVKNHKIVFEKESDALHVIASKQSRDRGEIAIGYESFAKEMKNSAEIFEFMSFDYGEKEARSDFSIRVYKEHEVTPLFDEGLDLSKYFQNSDITYDVVFNQVKEDFERAGILHVETVAQMSALVEMGLLDLLEMLKKNTTDEIYDQELQKAKMLIMPDFMGERFKMIRFRN